jgi:hypothetical protein
LRALLILEAKALVAKRNVRSDARRVVYVCSPQGRALLATSVLGAVGDLLVEGVQVRESRQQPLASDIQVPPIRIPLPEAGTNSPAGVPK